MSTTPKRRANRAVAPALAVTLLVLAGCSSTGAAVGEATSEPGDPRAPEVTNLTIAGYANASASPVMAAIELGIPEEYGVTIDYQPGDSAPAMFAQVVSGDVQVAQASAFYTIPAIEQGADVLIAGEVVRGMPDTHTVEALPNSGIEDVADLEGRRVAVVSLHSAQEARIVSAMISAGADPSTVEFVALGWNEMPAALEQGNVDAIATTGPARTQARSELGTHAVLDLAAGEFEEFPDSQWVVNATWAKKNPNALAAFQCSLVVRGQEAVMEDQQIYEAALREIGFSDESIASDVRLIYPAANDPATVIADMLVQVGWTDEVFDIESLTLPMPTNC